MKRTRPLFAASLLASMCLCGAAWGETTTTPAACAKRDVVLERLDQVFGETRKSIGLGANEGVIETYASAAGTWTIIVTMPSGISCVVASGQAFEQIVSPSGRAT